MTLTREQVLHIAELVKLTLTEEEVGLYQQQLTAILDYVAKLNELHTDDIPPTAQVIEQHNIHREDRAQPWLTEEEALGNAPDHDGQFVRVKPVLEE